MINATSFVISMLNTNGRKTKTAQTFNEVLAFFNNFPAKNENSPALWKPFMAAISENNKQIVSQSM